MTKLFKVIFSLSLMVLIGVGLYLAKSKNMVVGKNNAVLSFPTTKKEAIPFEELTIPYLRNRSYQSTLSELNQIGTSSTHTNYLTSYMSDGLKINGLLTKPIGTMPPGGWPAIVFIHGYIPPKTYQTQEKYTDYVNYLARNGFVVFKIDLRGHGQSEGESSGAYFSGDYVIDILNAVSALRSVDFVNPNQIGLWGHSMSGNLVFRAMTASSDISAGVIWAGAVYSYEDMSKYRINDGSYRPPEPNSPSRKYREQLFVTHGQFNKDSDFWRLVPGTNYLDNFKGALQIHHALNDNVVNIGYSRDLIKLLGLANIPHELYEYPDGGHNLSGASFSKAMERTVEFYSRYLQ